MTVPALLETTVDKLVFRVATDRLYSAEGIWVLPEEGGQVRLGLADFPQQRHGDVAFAEVRPVGTVLEAGDELAAVETIKASVSLPCPLPGTIVAANAAMETTPEVINKDPYGEGWLAVVAVRDLEAARPGLLGPEAYFTLMKRQVAEEARRP
jgi:glycine cleavage system H protein